MASQKPCRCPGDTFVRVIIVFKGKPDLEVMYVEFVGVGFGVLAQNIYSQ
jgi:hypothetical protein